MTITIDELREKIKKYNESLKEKLKNKSENRTTTSDISEEKVSEFLKKLTEIKNKT